MVFDIVTTVAKFGKKDVERLGLFIEMPYLNGKGYVSPFPNTITFTGKNMYGAGTKTLTAKPDALFEGKFMRIFEGEALPIRKTLGRPSPKGPTTMPFLPAPGPKKHSGTGDHFGTFAGKVERFDPQLKPRKKPSKPKINFLTRPVKKGGPGFVNICINAYPKKEKPDPYKFKEKPKIYGKVLGGPMRLAHHPQPYFEGNPFLDCPKCRVKHGLVYIRPRERMSKVVGIGYYVPVGPGKWPGGMHAGSFTPFPDYSFEPYVPSWKVLMPKREEKIFNPQSRAMKTLFSTSVMQRNVDFRLHHRNYTRFKPTYTKYLL